MEYPQFFFAYFFKAIKRELWLGNPVTLLWLESDDFYRWCNGWRVFPLDAEYLHRKLKEEWLKPPWLMEDE